MGLDLGSVTNNSQVLINYFPPNLLRVVLLTNRTLNSVMTIWFTATAEAMSSMAGASSAPDYPGDVDSVPVAPE